MSAEIQIRTAQEDDLGFMFETFSKSFAASSAYADGVSRHVLGDHLSRYLTSWFTTVATAPDDPSTILGWLCFKGPHAAAWIYVAPAYRRKGVARALLAAAGIKPGVIETPFAPTRHWLPERGWMLRFRPWMT